MSRLWNVKFRGDDWHAVVDRRIGSEGPTDWHFYGVDNDALNITAEEDESVVHQIREQWLENAMNSHAE